MKTVIELYDHEPILNLLAVCTLVPTPENVVFVGEFADRTEIASTIEWINGFLERKSISTNLHVVNVDMSDCSAIVEKLFELADKYPDCALEVTGGRDLALLAAGMVAENTDLPIFRYDIERRRFVDIRDFPEAEKFDRIFFTAGEILELAHADISRHGSFSPEQLSLAVRNDARKIWDIFLDHKHDWHEIALFFQSTRPIDGNELVVSTNHLPNGLSLQDRNTVAQKLASAGLIENLRTNKSQISFSYKNELIRSILRSTGAPLEIFVYSCLKRFSDEFNDCEINLCVDWDGDGPSRTENEIDLVAVRDHVPMFISCKSGRLNTNYLNEIFTVTNRLGGLFAKPVLVFAGDADDDENKYIAQRAEDMGIALISIYELCPKLNPHSRSGGGSQCHICPNRDCERALAERLIEVCEGTDETAY